MKELNLETSALYRNGILVLVLFCIALIVHNVFSQNGYLASRRERLEVQSLQQKIHHMKAENEQLDHENQALKNDPAAVERLAREQYGLVKPGDRVYSVPNQTPPSPPAAVIR